MKCNQPPAKKAVQFNASQNNRHKNSRHPARAHHSRSSSCSMWVNSPVSRVDDSIITPSTITYTVDGRTWATLPNYVTVPTNLALQQMLWPADDPWESATGPVPPTTEVDMQVDWVVVYSPMS